MTITFGKLVRTEPPEKRMIDFQTTNQKKNTKYNYNPNVKHSFALLKKNMIFLIDQKI